MDISGKLIFLLELLKETEQANEKVLVFSQSILLLNALEELLMKPQHGDFIRGIHYLRLDGTTKADDRLDLMKQFNKKTTSSRQALYNTVGVEGLNYICMCYIVEGINF